MIKAEDNIALKSTKSVNDTATEAKSTADNAKAIEDNTNQYFWDTSDTGAHITEKTQEAFLADPTNGGGNLLAMSNGIAVRDGLTELASFGADGMIVGKTDEKHIEIKPKAFEVYEEDGSVPFAINTSESRRTATLTVTSSVSGTGGTYFETTSNVYLRGALTDNRIYIGVSTTGKPTAFDSYIENPSSISQTLTIDGVECTAKLVHTSTIEVKFRNTTTTKKYVALRYTEQYYETSVKINKATFDIEHHRAILVDSIGTSITENCIVSTYGKIAQIDLFVYNTNSVIVGGMIYAGTLLEYLPTHNIMLVGRYGSDQVVVGILSSDGGIYLNNTGRSAFSSTSSAPIMLTATYIFK